MFAFENKGNIRKNKNQQINKAKKCMVCIKMVFAETCRFISLSSLTKSNFEASTKK